MTVKLLLGGLGGLTPLLAGVMVADVESVDTYVRQLWDSPFRGELYLFGYIVKVLLLAAFGMLWAFFYRSEPNLLKIYQLGIFAPAIIIGLINSNQIRDLTKKGTIERIHAPVPATQPSRPRTEGHGRERNTFWMSRAEAACPEGTCAAADGTCSARACAPSWYDKFVDGFLSRPAPRVMRCSVLRAHASIPYSSSATITERGHGALCIFSVDGATTENGATYKCAKFFAELIAPRGYVVALTETTDSCLFSVNGAR